MHNQQMKHLMRGAWILSLSSLIAKILSAVYRVPFQNMVGDTGFYAYQQIYPIYGLGMTFALSGFPVYISKLVAEADSLEAKRTVAHQSRVILTWISWALFLGLEFLGAAIGDGGSGIVAVNPNGGLYVLNHAATGNWPRLFSRHF